MYRIYTCIYYICILYIYITYILYIYIYIYLYNSDGLRNNYGMPSGIHFTIDLKKQKKEYYKLGFFKFRFSLNSLY